MTFLKERENSEEQKSSESSTPAPFLVLKEQIVQMRGLAALDTSARLFLSLLLCAIACCYLSLLGIIWLDTGMKVSNIIEAYQTMEFGELVHYSFQYTFWFVGIFTITGLAFLFTDYSEKTKRTFAVLTPLLILADIGSTWLIQYHSFFAYALFFSGLCLALSFLCMFILIQYNLWAGKFFTKKRG